MKALRYLAAYALLALAKVFLAGAWVLVRVGRGFKWAARFLDEISGNGGEGDELL